MYSIIWTKIVDSQFRWEYLKYEELEVNATGMSMEKNLQKFFLA